MNYALSTQVDGIGGSFALLHNESDSGVRMLGLVESKLVHCVTVPRPNRVPVGGLIPLQRTGAKCCDIWNPTRIKQGENFWSTFKVAIPIDTTSAICVPCNVGSKTGDKKRCSG